MEKTNLTGVWERVRQNHALRVGAVYAGASWFGVEAADTLGMDPARIRALALALGIGFLALVPTVWLLDRRAERAVRTPRRAGGGRWVAVAGGFALLAAGLWWFGSNRLAAAVQPDAQRMGVVPFRATGGAEIREFGEGVSDLLTAALDQVGEIRTVPARTMLAHLRRRGDVGDIALEDALDVAREVGAGSVLTGSVTAAGGGVRLNGEIRRSADGEVLASADVEGAPDALLSLTDALAVELLRQLWRSREPLPTVRVAAVTTSSPTALRAYLRGESHLRSARFDSAADAFRTATAEDSTFALAYVRLSQATGWSGPAAEGRLARRLHITRAIAHGQRLPEREQRYLRAHLLVANGAFAGLDSVAAYVQRYPEDPEGWYLLGDARFHAARYGVVDDDEIIAPMLEAVRLDPTYGLALFHALDMARDSGDREAFDSLLERWAAVAPEPSTASWRRQASVRWAPPDSVPAAFAAAIRNLHPVADRAAIGAVIGALGNAVRLGADVDPMAYIAALDSAALIFGSDRYWERRITTLRALLFASTGRTRESFAEWERWLDTDPPGGPPFPRPLRSAVTRITEVLRGNAPAEAVRDEVALIERSLDQLPEGFSSMLHIYGLRAGDAAMARRHPLDLSVPPDVPPFDTAAVNLLVLGVVAAFAGDTAAALRQLDEGYQRLGYYDGNEFVFGFIPYVETLARFPERREQAIRMLRWITINLSAESARAFLVLGRALEAEGDRVAAREAYNHVLRLWAAADDFRQGEVEEARQALVRLAEEG